MQPLSCHNSLHNESKRTENGKNMTDKSITSAPLRISTPGKARANRKGSYNMASLFSLYLYLK